MKIDVSVVFSGLGFIVSLFALYFTHNTYTLSTPPKIQIRSLQIWDKGHGSPLDPENPLPSFSSGSIICGSALVFNTGRTTAKIVSSDLFFRFMDRDPGMNNPGERDSQKFKLHKFESTPPYDLSGEPITKLDPGIGARWSVEIQVPSAGVIGQLYAFGNVRYDDTLGIAHGIYFSRKYDPERRDFISATERPDGVWAEF